MNYLLDVHALIWFLNGDDNFSKKSKELIENQKNLKLISIATIWEIAIKISLGKFKFELGFKNFVDLINENGFEIIPISIQHTLKVSTLEFIHRDPFDRLIIAQAITDNLTIMTKDEYIEKYDVKTIW